MLDQNTDRMWFVIGAVIVGAAIIFIANGTLPTLFASVADTFNDSSEMGADVVENLEPNIPHIIPKILIQEGPHSKIEDLKHEESGTSFICTHYPTSHPRSGAYFIIMDMPVKMDSQYVVSYDMQKLSGPPMRMNGYINNAIKNTFEVDGNIGSNSYYPKEDQLIHDMDKHHLKVGFDMTDPNMTEWTQHAIQPARYQALVDSGSTEPVVVKITNMKFEEVMR